MIRHFQKAGSVLIQTIVIALITLSLGEIVLGVYDYYRPSFIFYESSYNRFRRKPFADDWNFTLNSYGFKDEEFSDKKDGAYRILGIGDSFAFGVVPYQYNYLTLIESQLHPQYSQVEIYNLGIPSIGPKDYLSLFVNEGLDLQPDMVLLSFFIGNDFGESRKRKPHEYSYVASLLHYIVNIRVNYEGDVSDWKGQYCDDCPNFTREKYLQLESGRSLIYLEGNGRFPVHLDRALYYLDKIKTICETQGIDFLVAFVPDEVQINRDLWRDVRRVHFAEIENDQWDITLPNRALAKELDLLGIDYVDLYEYFADASNRQLYRPRDTHWNIAGNQLAADVLGRYIQKYLE